MRSMFVFAYLAAMVLTVVSHFMLPADVAIHFGTGGEADGWAPRILNTCLFAGLYTVLFFLFFFIPRMTLDLPAEYVSLPNKDYWLAPENRERAAQILADLIYEFGAAILAFFVVIGVLTLRANLVQPPRLDTRMFMVALVLFLAYTGVWCVRIFMAFKVPPHRSGPEPLQPR